MPDEQRRLDQLAGERDRFLADLPPYPEGRFAGRGAVVIADWRYEPGAFVAVQMLRDAGFDNPVQVWMMPGAHPAGARLAALPGVELVDAETRMRAAGRRLCGPEHPVHSAFAAKLFAVLHSPFEEVLYLDGDAYPVRPVAPLFDPSHFAAGWTAWSDFGAGDATLRWDAHRLPPRPGQGVMAAFYVVCKRRAWQALNVSSWIDDHLDTYHGDGNRHGTHDNQGRFQYADQDSARVAWAAAGFAPDFVARRPEWRCRASLHGGPDGAETLFVHRIDNKFGPDGYFPPHRRCHFETVFPGEESAWAYYLDWLRRDPEAGRIPDGSPPPGFESDEETAALALLARGRRCLAWGAFAGRSAAALALGGAASVAASGGVPRLLAEELARLGVSAAVEWLPAGAAPAGPLDLILFDAHHYGPELAADADRLAGLLAPGAAAVARRCGDPGDPQGVASAAREVAERHGWEPAGAAGGSAIYRKL